MSLLSFYSKIQLKIEKAEEKRVSAKSKANKRLFAFDLADAQLRLQLLFYQSLKAIVRVFALIFGDSSENFLIFTKLGKDSVFVCNNSYCQYKRFQKRVRFFTKTAFAGILICTIIATSVLYFMMPGKPSSQAATYNWVQTDWSGSANTSTFPNHNDNKTNWTDYYAKDSQVVVDGSGDLKLDYATGSWTETSDVDFGAGSGSNSAVIVNGTGDSASVKLDTSLLRLSFDCTGGTDHNGANWTPANGEEIYGKHCNIGTFTVATGTTVYVKAYSGGSYGTLEIEADKINIVGTLNGNGRGYPGGDGCGVNDNGFPGVGDGGLQTQVSGAGQGGGYCSGAGAGGHGNSGDTGSGDHGGAGGNSYGASNSYEIKMGAGGGEGNRSADSYDPYGNGGNGGAGIHLYGETINISGSVLADGNNGNQGRNFNNVSAGGGGGGGAGGTILINGNSNTIAGSLSAQGGNGGAGGSMYRSLFGNV